MRDTTKNYYIDTWVLSQNLPYYRLNLWLPSSHDHHFCSPVGETNFFLGLMKPVVGAVPVVAMYLWLQTIVNVSQKSHSKHIHRPFGDNCNQPLLTIRRHWSLPKQIAGWGWLVWISDTLLNIVFLDFVICPNWHCNFIPDGGMKRTHLSAQRFALTTRLIWTK